MKTVNIFRVAMASLLLAVGVTVPATVANAETTPITTKYENTSPSIQYTGTWVLGTNHSLDSELNVSTAKIGGDKATFSFKGTGIQIVSRTASFMGLANVYIDGQLVKTIDYYTPSTKYQQVVFSTDALKMGNHTLTIVRQGKHSAASTGNDINIDYLRVLDSETPAIPTGVNVTNDRMGVRITWNKSPEADIAGYRVYREEVGPTGARNFTTGLMQSVSGDTPLTNTTFLDVGLKEGTTYKFAVQAVDTSKYASKGNTILTVDVPTYKAPATRYTDCPTVGAIQVGTPAELRAALLAAKPGTVIHLKDGNYYGPMVITASGTAENPIWICGGKNAVLDNKNIASKTGFHMDHVSYVNVTGFSIQNFRKGVMATTSHHVSITDMNIHDIGEEGVKIRYSTTDSFIGYNTIHTTGLVEAYYGEGVYLGSSPKDWCAVNNCEVDRSDRNSVVGNNIYNTTADPIEAKGGTADGLIRDNHLDGGGLTAISTVMAIKGSGFLITDNVGINGKAPNGFTASFAEAEGGVGNVLARNSVDVPAGATAYYITKNRGSIVDCSNLSPVEGSILTNDVSCQK